MRPSGDRLAGVLKLVFRTWDSGTARIVKGSSCIGYGVCLATIGGLAAAHAQSAPAVAVQEPITAERLAALSIVLGIIIFATLASILFVRTREQLKQLETTSEETARDLRARLDRAETFVRADAEALIIWPADGDRAVVHNTADGGAAIPADSSELIAFGRWLDAASAGDLEAHVARLRDFGEGFGLMLRTRSGRFAEAEGRAGSGQVLVRFKTVQASDRGQAQARLEADELKRAAHDFEAIGAALRSPVWIVSDAGRLVYANAAYAAVAGFDTADEAITAEAFVLPRAEPGQDAETGDLGLMSLDQGRSPRRYAITAVRCGRGVGYVARDVEEVLEVRRTLHALEAAHSHTLAQLKTGVAAVDADRRLIFHNPAFQDLWQLADDQLADRPDFGEVLDQLRAAGRLPEMSKDYRVWRDGLLSRDRPSDAEESQWHLPDGRTLRVIIDPQPDGGLTYLFENVTESIALQTRFVALSRVQRETIDSLGEGIVVFGSDGRLKLHNPAWQAQWQIDDVLLADRPRVDDLIRACEPLYEDDQLWGTIKGAVTGLADARRPFNTQIERADGLALALSMVPLPDGGTLVVFADVTDSRRIERALRDSNEALRKAAQIKNDFVHKVSYELRSPLTNIIGFTHLLSEPTTGSMNDRQREYAGYILSSSSALLAIVNDILDLATIDAGVMELDIRDIDLAQVLDSAVAGVRDRLDDHGVRLNIDIADGIGPIEADETRLKQIVFNLTSNAVGFSESGQQVDITARATDDDRVEIAVVDRGPGIDPEQVNHVFERFQSDARGTRHRGAGLGLNIVRSLVELHGGTVELTSSDGQGTRAVCTLPRRQKQTDGADDERLETPPASIAGDVLTANITAPAATSE
ncbi:MAG: ATP-binding protein [Pseudomonadota bacterium]